MSLLDQGGGRDRREGVAEALLRGEASLRAGRFTEAIKAYRAVLRLEPRHWSARLDLALALRSAQRYGACGELLQALAEEQPDNGFVQNQLGKLFFLRGAFEAALASFQRAVALDPSDSDSLYWIGGVKHAMGDLGGANAEYARAASLAPLFRRPARQAPPAFSVLLLCAPVAGNTPVVYLTDHSTYETNVLLLFADGRYDLDLLRTNGQVLVNLVSDADQAQGLLPLAADLVDRLGLPVINHPRQVLQTTREAMAQRLQSLEGCRVPHTVRYPATGGTSPRALQAAVDLPFPLLARPAGTHGGESFDKFPDLPRLCAFLERSPGLDHYLIEYLDYASADGLYRKYRFIFVEGRILPYHLAIGADWKVHHATTDMVHHAWMRDEERAFLASPGQIFSAEHFAALQAIHRAVELDYFGVDCGVDRSGNLVVFEVNASMLVHEDDEPFTYKNLYVREIKRTFDAMLARRAGATVDR